MIRSFINSRIKAEDEVLDVGCGNRTNWGFPCKKIIGIDGWDKVNPDVLVDLNTNPIPFEENSFDVVLMIDFIEHLDKEAGFRIIEEAKKIARREVLLMTPLWWTDNADNTENPRLWCYNNPFNYHKSLWVTEDFEGFEREEPSGELENYFLGSWKK